MDVKEFFSKLEESKKKLVEELVKEVEENIEKNKIVWKPENGATIYQLEPTGEVLQSFYVDIGEDQKGYEQGNVFDTKEAAEFEATRRKYLAMYERMSIEAGELNNAWDGDNFHYAAFYDNGIRVGGFTNTRDMNIHFPSEETCRNAVETIGEDNFKKYILKIGE